MGYLELYFLISNYLDLFALSFIHFWFNPIIIKKHVLYYLSSYKFIEISFVAQNMNYLGECSHVF